MKEEMRHAHPIMIVHTMKSFGMVLIIPLVRGFFTAFSGNDIWTWLEGAWIDLSALSAVLLVSVLIWRCCVYACTPEGLYLRTGVLIRRELFIPAARIATISAVRAFYLKPFRAVRLRVDTVAGEKNEADLSLFVVREEAQRMLKIRSDALCGSALTRQYRPHNVYVLALAAFSSSSFAGIFFISTLISQTGALLGNAFNERIYGTFERFTQLLAFGLPPAAAAIGYVILFGWLVAFAINFIRHKNLCLKRQGGGLLISSGIFTNRHYVVDMEKINFVDVRQSVLSWILRHCSVHIHAAGYAKYKDDVSGVVPAVKKKDVQKTLNLFFPEYKAAPRQLRHNAGALFKFIGDPAWGCVLIPGATLLLRWWIPGWGAFIGWVGFMLCFPAYWFLVVRLIDYFTSGIAREGNIYTLHYSAGYFLHTIVLPIDKIASVCIRQSPIQYFDKKCDLLLFSFAEKKTKHHIRNLDQQAVQELFGLRGSEKCG